METARPECRVLLLILKNNAIYGRRCYMAEVFARKDRFSINRECRRVEVKCKLLVELRMLRHKVNTNCNSHSLKTIISSIQLI